MICEDCGSRPATVHVTRIINGQERRWRLCQECAQERGELGFMAEPSFTFHDILAGLFEPESVLGQVGAKRTRVRCPSCGLSFADFRRLGHLGCSECYEVFDRQLEPLLRRIHGNTRHAGRAPGSHVKQAPQEQASSPEQDLRRLREELNRAIEAEEYEKAAKLRDQIRALEASLGGADKGR